MVLLPYPLSMGSTNTVIAAGSAIALALLIAAVWATDASTPTQLATTGVLVLIAVGPLMDHVAPWGLFWLVAGGLAYTLGVVFYALERLRYFHFIWHLFVIAGSACHFIAVLWYAA